MKNVDIIRSRRTGHEIDLLKMSADLVKILMNPLRTPTPFKKKQQQVSIKPTCPGTNCMASPQSKIDIGTKTSAPGIVARSRSSGTQRSPRNLRQRTTSLSDMAPERGEPTVEAGQASELRGKHRLTGIHQGFLLQAGCISPQLMLRS